MKIKMLFCFFIILIFNIYYVNCFPGSADEVTALPGLNFTLNFKQYSGFLNSTNGGHLHYWFVESQNNPSEDPLVLWLNGGPGCSSVFGLLTEQGPLHVHKDGKTLYKNKYAWNLIANVIFLESPAGVGFSYNDAGQYTTDDDQVSEANLAALRSFFVKFPQYKKNKFFVTGESYGGVYVPTLSVRILKEASDINFKGFAVGNGFLDSDKLGNSLIFFAYYHGLIGRTTWSNLVQYCCNGTVSQKSCNFVETQDLTCSSTVNDVMNVILQPELDIYNLYHDCESSSSSNSPVFNKYHVDKKLMLEPFIKPRLINQVKLNIPCIDTSFVTKWINQPEARENLHIPQGVPDWSACSAAVNSNYQRIYSTMKPQVLQLINNNLTGIIYNGDVDMACNFLGDEWFVDDLNLQLVQDYTSWHYNNQIAGFVKKYKGLSFYTIKGSGHTVPQDKPGPALQVFHQLINNA